MHLSYKETKVKRSMHFKCRTSSDVRGHKMTIKDLSPSVERQIFQRRAEDNLPE